MPPCFYSSSAGEHRALRFFAQRHHALPDVHGVPMRSERVTITGTARRLGAKMVCSGPSREIVRANTAASFGPSPAHTSPAPLPARTGSQQERLTGMNDVTRILSAIEHGDPEAAEQLVPLVYEELRKLAAQRLANEKPGQTFQATALVHEAYVRLVDVEKAQHWNSRGHFFGAAAEAMRRILVERARHKRSLKAGGDRHRQDLSDVDLATVEPNIESVRPIGLIPSMCIPRTGMPLKPTPA
jgi:hypothetical protein